MYGGAVAVPLIVGQAAGLSREEIAFLINADLLVAGIATLVQSIGIGPVGIRMPVMMGASFAAVGSMVVMAGMPGVGLQGIFGATIAAGFFGLLLAPSWRASCGSSAAGHRHGDHFHRPHPVPRGGQLGRRWQQGRSVRRPGIPRRGRPGAGHHPAGEPFHARLLGQCLGADRHGGRLCRRRRHGHGRPHRPGAGALVPGGHPAAFRHAQVRAGAGAVDVPGSGDHLRRVHRHVPSPGQDHRSRGLPQGPAPWPACDAGASFFAGFFNTFTHSPSPRTSAWCR